MFFWAFFCIFSWIQVFAEESPFKLDALTEKQGLIWGMVFIDANRILFTERSGEVKVLDLKTKAVEKVHSQIPSVELGQGGLMDVEKHPEFSKNKTLFFSYTIKKSPKENLYTTQISSARLSENPLRLDEMKVIFTANAFSSQSIHFGSRIVFDSSGFLYASIGERNEREKAQKLDNHHGKIIRILPNGAIPKDNPFTKTPGALPEIWSFGHRNPQGLFYDATQGKLYSTEHGPRGGDELNLIQKGKNYGWPIITYGREYYGPKIGKGTHAEGIEQPLHQWTPSLGASDLLVVRGFQPWKESFLTGALALTHLHRLSVQNKDHSEEKLFSDQDERVRCLLEGGDGSIYMGTDSGRIFRISKK